MSPHLREGPFFPSSLYPTVSSASRLQEAQRSATPNAAATTATTPFTPTAAAPEPVFVVFAAVDAIRVAAPGEVLLKTRVDVTPLLLEPLTDVVPLIADAGLALLKLVNAVPVLLEPPVDVVPLLLKLPVDVVPVLLELLVDAVLTLSVVASPADADAP